MINTDFLHHLDRLSLIINKRITSNYTGERKTSYTGEGLVFKDYTIYTPGEDLRAVDWKVYGRTEKLFIKRFEEERNLTVHVIVDFSASMNFKSKQLKKSEYASMFGIGLAYMALKNNERFVISTFADQLNVFRPKKGKRQLMFLLQHLNEQQPKGVSNFEASLAKYKSLINSKSFVAIISDFLYDINQIKSVLYRLKNQEVKLIQILDPLEAELNMEGDYKLRDLESEEQVRTYVSPYLRKHYLEKLNAHSAEIKRVCAETGAQFFSFSTNTPIFDAFYQVFSHGHAHMG